MHGQLTGPSCYLSNSSLANIGMSQRYIINLLLQGDIHMGQNTYKKYEYINYKTRNKELTGTYNFNLAKNTDGKYVITPPWAMNRSMSPYYSFYISSVLKWDFWQY